ncbi:MAG: dihydrofolate reductase family protein [Corynebacterium casei]|nr:dihydrofolate reductase family protein [Corynebacterium casei]
MRELIVTEMVSLDGVMEAPGGEDGYRNAGWTFNEIEFDPAAYELKGTEQEEAGALLLGRTSYQAFAPVWPQMEDFARYNAMPRFVVSTSLDTDDEHWPATILRNLEEVRALKAGDLGDFDGPILVHGSGTLVKSLQEEGLIDKLHLLVFPVLLGQGKRLFSEAELSAEHLTLEQHESYSNGIQKMVFRIK